jgi:hypothetical protein
MLATKSPKKKTFVIPTTEFLDTVVPRNRRATDIKGTYRYATSEEVNKVAGLDTPTKGLLQRAHETITGPRQADYGDKLQNFSQIAMLFQGVLATKLLPDSVISAEDVALLMMQVKIARLAKSPNHKDSILDVAGYAGCYDSLQEERSNGYVLKGATYDSRSGE